MVPDNGTLKTFERLADRGFTFDLDAITDLLREQAVSWVPQHFPNGKRDGDDWRLADIGGRAPNKSGSCVISLKGPHAGDWFDFEGDVGGGPLSTLGNATGLEGRELYSHAADLVGWSADRRPPRRLPASREVPDKDIGKLIDIIISGATSIGGTVAETYLRSRRVEPGHYDDLLFHPNLKHSEAKRSFPALLGVVRDFYWRHCCAPSDLSPRRRGSQGGRGQTQNGSRACWRRCCPIW